MIKALRGTYDILPTESGLWQKVEQTARELFAQYGYNEIRTPVFERTELFVRSIGEVTDIVEKEMYTFQDKKGRSLTLRPEGTACVVRACLEHKLLTQQGALQKLYYLGPMFRYERPQAGRQRQFNQIGVEMFGTYSPLADVEVIAMMVRFFESLGLKGLSVNINSLGDAESLGNFNENLRKFFSPQLKELCTDCQRRFEKNILRVLDCKNPDCKKIASSPEVPTMRNSLTEEAKQHYESVLKILEKIGISYNENEKLVRGLDYYTHTIFEVTHSSLGAQDALGGGGRYNNLVKEFGGSPTGAVGFAIGVERLIIALKKLEQTETNEAISVFFVSFDEPALIENIVFAESLRKSGITAVTGYKKQSVKAQMRQANSFGAKWVIMRGEDERQKSSVKIKNMETSEEKIVDENKIEESVRCYSNIH